MIHFNKFLKLAWLLPVLSYFIFSLLYINPGNVPFLKGDTTLVLSDGTDPVTFPYQFKFLKDQFLNAPKELLYGAVYNPHMDYPQGIALWIAPLERIIDLFLSFVIPVEQVSTGLVIVYMVMDGIFMYLLSRAMAIPNLVSWAMGFAWAFNAFTRARAKVHMGLVGIYHLPLIFLALILLSRGKKRTNLLAVLFFLMIAASPHYYVITLAVFTPFLLIFYWLQRPAEEPKNSFYKRLFLCSIPAILLLVYCLKFPLSPSVKNDIAPYPKTGEFTDRHHHPFLDTYSAGPLDYITGDIGAGTKDPNPFKEYLNTDLEARLYERSNPHEKALGIRWSILLIALLAICGLLPSSKSFWIIQDRKFVLFFTIFGLACFWLSMPPGWPVEWGPSYWLSKLVPQIRVPNRAGIGVAFSAIILSGLFLKNFLIKSMWKPGLKMAASGVFALFVILELPPMYQDLPVSQILPPYKILTENRGCGVGFKYPYVSGKLEILDYYYLLQRMRGSTCEIINSSVFSTTDLLMTQNFARLIVLPKLARDAKAEAKRLRIFADCVPLSWIILKPSEPGSVGPAEELCYSMGWKWDTEGVCHDENLNRKPLHSIESCLKQPKSE